jgi:hypothetical protein
LDVLDRVDAEGARAKAGEGTQEKAAREAGTPGSTPVSHFHSRNSVVTARIALEEHRDVRGGVDDPVGLHQRHLLIMHMLMEVAWLRLGHGLWSRWLIPEPDLTLIAYILGHVPNLRLLIHLLRLGWQLLLLIVLLRSLILHHSLRSIARLLNKNWAWLHHRLLLCTNTREGMLAWVLRLHLLVRVGGCQWLLFIRGIHFIIL